MLAARSLETEALAAELGESAIAVSCDVADPPRQEAMVATAIKSFGSLDIVFANAGFGGARSLGPDSTDSPERWREMVLTNVLGAAYTIRACFAAITEARGHILITGSVIGRKVVPARSSRPRNGRSPVSPRRCASR